jgi:hypothetical protein
MLVRALILGVCLACAGTAVSETPPMQVTSDTPEYCARLAAQISQGGSSSPEVARLEEEGQTLCREGFVQGGLHRLRRALAVMRQQATP